MSLMLIKVGAGAFVVRALWDIVNIVASKKDDFRVDRLLFGAVSDRIKAAVDRAIQEGVIDVGLAIGTGATGITGAIGTGVVGVGSAFGEGSVAIAQSIGGGASDMGEAFAEGMAEMFAPVVGEVRSIEQNVERTEVALESIAEQATPGANLLTADDIDPESGPPPMSIGGMGHLF